MRSGSRISHFASVLDDERTKAIVSYVRTKTKLGNLYCILNLPAVVWKWIQGRMLIGRQVSYENGSSD
jgi:hypothetical protein